MPQRVAALVCSQWHRLTSTAVQYNIELDQPQRYGDYSAVVLLRYGEAVCWSCLTELYLLTTDGYRLMAAHLDWDIALKRSRRRLSFDVIADYSEYVDLDAVSGLYALPAWFIDEHPASINWTKAGRGTPIPHRLLKKYKKLVNWRVVWSHQDISTDLLDWCIAHGIHIDWAVIYKRYIVYEQEGRYMVKERPSRALFCRPCAVQIEVRPANGNNGRRDSCSAATQEEQQGSHGRL